MQDKRATRMDTHCGINTNNGNYLYDASTITDYYTILIKTTEELHTKADVKKYMDIDDVLYFKFAVKMPNDVLGSGYEMVPGYATVEDYGISDDHHFWIRVGEVENASPFQGLPCSFFS